MSETKDFVVGFLVGGLVGLGAGILLAPDSGENTRNRIKLQAQNVAGDVRDSASEFTIRLKDGAEDAMRRAGAEDPTQFVECSLAKAEAKLGELQDQLDSQS